MRDDKHVKSFKLSMVTGAWRDRANGTAGGALDLYAGINRLSLQDAARKAVEVFGLPSGWETWDYSFLERESSEGRHRPSREPTADRTASAPAKEDRSTEWAPALAGLEPIFRSSSGAVMHPVAVYRYETSTGELAFAVGRFE